MAGSVIQVAVEVTLTAGKRHRLSSLAGGDDRADLLQALLARVVI